jgi:hypothetical protein
LFVNEVLKNLSSPSSLVGVIVVSFVVNLFSAYAKPYLARALDRRSARHRQRSEEARVKRYAEVREVLATPDGIVLLSLEELKCAVGGVLCVLLLLIVIAGCFLAGTPSAQEASRPAGVPVLLGVVVLLFLILAIALINRASAKGELGRLARQERAKSTTA